MKAVPSLIASLIVIWPAATLLADDLANWKAYPLASHGSLIVNLRVRPAATLADEEWLAIEFVNREAMPIKVKEARYSIEASYHDLQGGKYRDRGSFASGNTESLFPDAWRTPPVGPTRIPPGTYRVVEQPSSYSSALLGLAPDRGLRIKAAIQLELMLGDGTKVTTGPRPQPFEFEWLRPDSWPTLSSTTTTVISSVDCFVSTTFPISLRSLKSLPVSRSLAT